MVLVRQIDYPRWRCWNSSQPRQAWGNRGAAGLPSAEWPKTPAPSVASRSETVVLLSERQRAPVSCFWDHGGRSAQCQKPDRSGILKIKPNVLIQTWSTWPFAVHSGRYQGAASEPSQVWFKYFLRSRVFRVEGQVLSRRNTKPSVRESDKLNQTLFLNSGSRITSETRVESPSSEVLQTMPPSGPSFPQAVC